MRFDFIYEIWLLDDKVKVECFAWSNVWQTVLLELSKCVKNKRLSPFYLLVSGGLNENSTVVRFDVLRQWVIVASLNPCNKVARQMVTRRFSVKWHN